MTIKMLITLEGREPRAVRRHIGYVSQLLSADGGLTGYENLMLSARLSGIRLRERRTRIDEALVTMDLTEAARRVVNTYSGGMVRRLEIAQATLHHPAVLILAARDRAGQSTHVPGACPPGPHDRGWPK